MGSYFDLRESPQPVFYPSMVCNFQIRFDEGTNTTGAPVSVASLGGAGTQASTVSTSNNPALLAAGSDNLSQLLGVVPRSCVVELPNYRQAGTFQITMAFRDLPLDPRIIRALGVAIHLDAAAPPDFADGMTSAQLFDADLRPGARRKSIIETTPENNLLAGLADSVTVEHSSRGSVLSIDGRDLRGVFLDSPIDADTLRGVDVTKPIDEVVAHIVNDLHPQGAGMLVQVNAAEWVGQAIPSPCTLDDATRVNLDALGQTLRATAKGEAGSNTFWDLITNLCLLVGAVPYFQGSVLRIRPARTIYDARRNERNDAFDPDFPTPFKGGEDRNVRSPLVSEAEQFAFRRLVLGQDIENLRYEKKLAGFQVPTIRVQSYDTSSGVRGNARFKVVEHPPPTEDAARTTAVGPSGQVPQNKVVTINVPGIKNEERLRRIAEDVYEEIGRQELGGSVETRNLASFGGDNQDPDLLRLRPGDPVQLRVDSSSQASFPPTVSPLTDIKGLSFEQAVAQVAERVGDEDLARVLVQSNRGDIAALTDTFRTANVRFNWDASSGVGIAFDFQNFVEARYAVTPDTKGPTTAAQGGAQ